MSTHHFTRVDTLEMKKLIHRKIGNERAQKYFDNLARFLGCKLNKDDLDKSCLRTLGRANLSLHNQLLQGILRNACSSEVPPWEKAEVPIVKLFNGYQRNCLQSIYGGALPQPPRKCKSPVSKDRKLRERPSPLGPLGKSPSVPNPSGSQFRAEGSSDGEQEVEQSTKVEVPRWKDITAPIGVSIETRKPSDTFKNRDFGTTCASSGVLPDTRYLMRRMQEKLAAEGVGISPDCANVLNSGLDVFLKRIIEPCIGIAKSRGTDQQGQNGDLRGRFGQRETAVNMLDFRVAMESNPRLLGVDWPEQLEKICSYEGRR